MTLEKLLADFQAEHLTPQRSNGLASMVERICTDSRHAMSGEPRV
jgi:sulfur transfer protein SufE